MRNCYNEVPLSCERVLLCVDESGWGTYAVLLSLRYSTTCYPVMYPVSSVRFA